MTSCPSLPLVTKPARSAFTLIEVLVVVAIIALLVSILIPSLIEARDQARSARCLANMQDMGRGTYSFAATHRNRFQVFANALPGPTYATVLQEIGDPGRNIYAYESGPRAATPSEPNLLAWSVVLAKESGARSIKANADWGVVGADNAIAARATIPRFDQLICTADKIEFGGTAAPSSPVSPGGGQQPWYYGFLSYIVNLDIVGAPKQPGQKGVWKDGNGTMSPNSGSALGGQLDKVIRPSEVMLFADGGPTTQKWATSPNGGSFSKHLGTAGPGTAPHAQDPVGPLLEYADVAYINILRHERHRRNSVNLTYADGHGSFVRKFHNRKYDPAIPMLPTDKYTPKTRVSPYNSGQFQ